MYVSSGFKCLIDVDFPVLVSPTIPISLLAICFNFRF
jgi:hypothetical protein